MKKTLLHIGFVACLLIASQPAKATPSPEVLDDAKQKIYYFCAKVVGIGYGSEDFSDDEGLRFLYCKDTLFKASDLTD